MKPSIMVRIHAPEPKPYYVMPMREGQFGDQREFVKKLKDVGLSTKEDRRLFLEAPVEFIEAHPQMFNFIETLGKGREREEVQIMIDGFFRALRGETSREDYKTIKSLGSLLYDTKKYSFDYFGGRSLSGMEGVVADLAYQGFTEAFYEGRLTRAQGMRAAAIAFCVNRFAKMAAGTVNLETQNKKQERLKQLMNDAVTLADRWFESKERDEATQTLWTKEKSLFLEHAGRASSEAYFLKSCLVVSDISETSNLTRTETVELLLPRCGETFVYDFATHHLTDENFGLYEEDAFDLGPTQQTAQTESFGLWGSIHVPVTQLVCGFFAVEQLSQDASENQQEQLVAGFSQKPTDQPKRRILTDEEKAARKERISKAKELEKEMEMLFEKYKEASGVRSDTEIWPRIASVHAALKLADFNGRAREPDLEVAERIINELRVKLTEISPLYIQKQQEFVRQRETNKERVLEAEKLRKERESKARKLYEEVETLFRKYDVGSGGPHAGIWTRRERAREVLGLSDSNRGFREPDFEAATRIINELREEIPKKYPLKKQEPVRQWEIEGADKKRAKTSGIMEAAFAKAGQKDTARPETHPKSQDTPDSKQNKPIHKEHGSKMPLDEQIRLLEMAATFLEDVRTTSEPKDSKNVDKISKLRLQSKQMLKEVRAAIDKIRETAGPENAQINIGDLASRSERLAEKIAHVLNERTDWTKRYREYREAFDRVVKMNDAVLSEASTEKVIKKLIALSKQRDVSHLSDDILEEILFDVI